MDSQGRAGSGEALCLCELHLSLKELDFKSPKKVPAGLSETTARGLAWTADRSNDGSAPVPSRSRAGLICWIKNVVCSTNTDQYPDHWPGGSSNHLVSGHLFLKQTAFRLPRGWTGTEKVLLLFAGLLRVPRVTPLPGWNAP